MTIVHVCWQFGVRFSCLPLAFDSKLVMIINDIFACVCVCSVKVAYSSDNSVKAVLLKDKTAKAEPGAKPQQYIEVSLAKLYTSLLNSKTDNPTD